ncbi:thioredoxin fold domain-containing protein [Acidiferrobacter sp. SPIII_3]|uniref:thioredoxin fold domain-containing protein n=1 Tax=Acidiferrobacter sp. SPIII_3 TaxID=1281578 RepID=UPI0011AB8D07|nr:thioredoxin fold domain-containing protein [Acidiferrobacter sp. SPIII_3]
MRGTTRITAGVLALLMAAGGAQARPADNTRLWTFVRHTTTIREGRHHVRLYVFFDPNCPYCHDLYEALQPIIRSQGLGVRFVPVGILALSSYGKAAALLEASRPQAAMARMEAGFHGGRGAIRPRRATAPVARALLYNVRLFEAAGAQGVPFLVYKTRAGHVHTVTGDPPATALEGIVARITGHPRSTPRTATP